MSVFLEHPSLAPLWRAAAAALDRNGLAWRGRLRLPEELLPEGRRRLGVLLEQRIGVGRRTVDLAELADGVARLTGAELAAALTAVGHPPSGRRDAALARRDTARRRRDELDAAVAREFPGAGWVSGWRDAAWTDGLLARADPEEVAGLVGAVRAVLDAASGGTRSRSEIAAQLFGDAHTLDSSARLAALTTRALAARDGPGDERAVWERAGMPLDLVSAPVLTWGLPLRGEDGAAPGVRAMTAAGLPVQLSVMALRAAPLDVARGTAVLVVENPRLVEAAAQRRLPAPVLTTTGNPTTAPALAITQLAAAGAVLRYHGDFDAAGLAITGRMIAAGATPWRMDASDYRAALDAARRDGVTLPRDPAPAPPTPWDPELSTEFDRHRAVVHEERVMDGLLAEHALAAQARLDGTIRRRRG